MYWIESQQFIALVKQKCGIMERGDYNKPKIKGTRQLKCLTDKEKANMKARDYFGMVWTDLI